VRLFHDVGHVIDLILQNENIARCKVRQDLVGIVLRNLAVGAAVENDAVLPAALDLNDRVTVRASRMRLVSTPASCILSSRNLPSAP